MAATVFRADRTKALTNQLLGLLDRIGTDFAQLKAVFATMTQYKDGDGSQVSHFAEVQSAFGFKDAAGAASNTVAKGSYDEINSFIGNGGPSLEQCVARHRQ